MGPCCRLIALLLLVSTQAHAEDVIDRSAEARERFTRGSELYARRDYQAALDEFNAAQALSPSPALTYDIGRCYEGLDRWDEAAAAYERYVAATPPDPTTQDVAFRARSLRQRAASQRSGAGRRRTYGRAALGLGVATLGAAAAAAGLLGSVAVDLDGLRATCTARQCTDADLAPFQHRAYAGYALLAVAGAGAIIDIGLIAAWAHSPRGGAR